jgi:hypothetical protein
VRNWYGLRYSFRYAQFEEVLCLHQRADLYGMSLFPCRFHSPCDRAAVMVQRTIVETTVQWDVVLYARASTLQKSRTVRQATMHRRMPLTWKTQDPSGVRVVGRASLKLLAGERVKPVEVRILVYLLRRRVW